MDKNGIKKFATEARRELISRVSQRAQLYGITPEDTGNPNEDTVNGRLLTAVEKKQRAALIQEIEEKGYEQVMEEVACTWFNRFCALRFMEVNGYLPTRVRVFTDENNAFKPQILAEAIHLDLEGLDQKKVFTLKEADANDELYKYLLITQCNALNAILPKMFQKINDTTELLFPDNLLREGSVLHQMITIIPEEDWNVSDKGEIEIIGWLYQYYISEKHEAVIDPIHGKIIEKEDVPAATQLFTTDWVVRFIVDNSLGKYWVKNSAKSGLAERLEYYIPESYNKSVASVSPETITFLDPCVGSGHFAVYAFDVYLEIYREYGYTDRDAVASIIKNNLYGIDIDERAAQLAYFSVMMKARQYDRRFLNRGIQPNIYAITESNRLDTNAIDYFCDGDSKLKESIETIISELKDAKEYGSLLYVTTQDWDAIDKRFWEIESDSIMNIYSVIVLDELRYLVNVAKALSKKYTIVATNPPYMNKYSDKLRAFLNEKYRDYSGDMFSAFMYRNLAYCSDDGFSGFMTPSTWMSAKQYEKLREYIYERKGISSFVQMAKGAFFKEATVDVCAFVLSGSNQKEDGQYIRLEDFKGDMDIQGEKVYEGLSQEKCDYLYSSNTSRFASIPGKPIAYWISSKGLDAFAKGLVGDIAITKQGFKTGNNNLFLRLWYEVNIDTLFLGKNKEEKVWFPCNKGGNYRKWYGNNEYAVYWKNNGEAIINYRDEKGRQLSRPQNIAYNFREGLTWSTLSSGPISFRYSSAAMMFESKGSECFVQNPNVSIWLLQGFLNSKVCMYYLAALAPTVDYSEGSILKLPFLQTDRSDIQTMVQENIRISRNDWDSFEPSWDFVTHPLITYRSGAGYHDVTMDESQYRIADAYRAWEDYAAAQFDLLKKNEEELNRIFIDIYGLQDELIPEVDDKDVTVRKADLERDIKSFISYAVGCMFGRYSLDVEGLAFAGGEWDEGKYRSFPADRDNIIPICDDEYFEDDILSRFVKFVEVVYGESTLEENLAFIADALGGKGQPRDVIRDYFLKRFYKDHCKTYQKRPIYWLFDSGKKNGFKCLIYMHRYSPDTIARIRTDYVHEQQARYRGAIDDLEARMDQASTGERVKLGKKLKKVTEQAKEVLAYEEKVHHLADQMVSIDLDDGVKVNYAKFQDALAKIK